MGVCEISQVSICGEVYGGKDLGIGVFQLSLEWKTEEVIDGDNGGDDSVDPTCSWWWEGEDQDVDEAHGKNEEVYSKGGVLGKSSVFERYFTKLNR